MSVFIQEHISKSDIHMSVQRNIISNYSQQDATFLDLLISKDALHVSGGSSAHHQEHITVQTASGIVNQYCS
jgi:predicted nucleic-acid-binding protein